MIRTPESPLLLPSRRKLPASSRRVFASDRANSARYESPPPHPLSAMLAALFMPRALESDRLVSQNVEGRGCSTYGNSSTQLGGHGKI